MKRMIELIILLVLLAGCARPTLPPMSELEAYEQLMKEACGGDQGQAQGGCEDD